MDVSLIVYPVVTIASMGLLFGVGLGYAAKVFAVEEDERIGLIRALLPGANCGGCGFPGCDGLAKAIAAGEAGAGGCPVGGAALAEGVAGVMGVKAEAAARRVAFVRCGGGEAAVWRYDYAGLADCAAAAMLAGGGAKACAYGCLGGGSCVRACPFGAMAMRGGVAAVDKEKCRACGVCVAKCPRGLIEMAAYETGAAVACASGDAGKATRAVCGAGCLGCGLCVKACGYGAISVTGNLARVDAARCAACGECVKKCPTKAIRGVLPSEG